MTMNAYPLTKENGSRNVKVCNHFRKEMFEAMMELLTSNGFAPVVAANGDIAIPTCVDETTGETYYTRLSVSFSNKPLEHKVERKPSTTKAPVADELPSLFA